MQQPNFFPISYQLVVGEEKVSDYINKQFALPAGIPGRKGYTDSFSNFGQIFPIRKYANALDRINKIINTAPHQ